VAFQCMDRCYVSCPTLWIIYTEYKLASAIVRISDGTYNYLWRII
jgi:hypothetical protein